jgi:phosphohistidine phosphatase
MHRLHLLRHAKAERDGSGADKERRLSRRGRDEARLVGKTLPRAIGAIDLVLCSSAVRTRETAELALARYERMPHILYEDALYLAGASALLRRLRDLDEGAGTVLVVGHNPGLQELAATLAADASPHYGALAAGKFPTAARASFAIDGPWAGLDRGRHVLVDFVTPKSLG